MPITNQKQIDECKAEILFSYDAEKVKAVSDKVAKDVAKTYKVSGFRPRKGSVEAAKYGKNTKPIVMQYTREMLVNDAFQDILFENKWKPFSNPQVDDTNISFNGFSAKFTVGYLPEFELAAYKEIEINEPENLASREVIYDKLIAQICGQFSENKPFGEDDFILAGDNAIVNYVGTIDGKEFIDNKAEGVLLEIGKSNAIVGFEDNLIGMKVGEKREFELKLDDKFGVEQLRGKVVKFVVDLVSAAKKDAVPFDGALAEKLKFENFDKMVESVNKQVDEYMENARIGALKGLVAEKLLELNEIKIPEWMIRSTAESTMEMRGAKFGMLPDKQKEYLLSETRKNIKTSFIIDKIKSLEVETVLSEQELISILNQNMMRFPDEIKRELIEKRNEALYAKIFTDIQNEHVIKWVIGKAKIVKKEGK